jgi:hypothetical protein
MTEHGDENLKINAYEMMIRKYTDDFETFDLLSINRDLKPSIAIKYWFV